MDTDYLAYVKVDTYLNQKEFKKCENLLTELIDKNLDVTDADKSIMVELLKKRILVYQRLEKYSRVLDDIQLLMARNVIIDSNDPLFYIQQQAILNCAIDEVTQNLNDNLRSSNELFFNFIKQFLDMIKSKDVFNEKTFDDTKGNGKKKRL